MMVTMNLCSRTTYLYISAFRKITFFESHKHHTFKIYEVCAFKLKFDLISISSESITKCGSYLNLIFFFLQTVSVSSQIRHITDLGTYACKESKKILSTHFFFFFFGRSESESLVDRERDEEDEESSRNESSSSYSLSSTKSSISSRANFYKHEYT